MPTHIESRESANPKIKASFKSIPREWSKSKGIGSLITKKPRKIKIPELIILVKKSESILLIKFPIKKEKLVKQIDINISNDMEKKPIFAFFIPYVMPIPRESILTDKARIIEFIMSNFQPPIFT